MFLEQLHTLGGENLRSSSTVHKGQLEMSMHLNVKLKYNVFLEENIGNDLEGLEVIKKEP